MSAVMDRLNPLTLPGWCNGAKSEALTRMVIGRKIKLSVEIGVYGGRSLFSLAIGHEQAGGRVIGIDAWDKGIAHQHGMTSENARTVATDFEKLASETKALAAKHFPRTVQIIHAASVEAFTRVPDGIELLHIDGNHSPDCVYQDVHFYAPKMKPGALIIFDDASWAGVRNGINLARVYGFKRIKSPHVPDIADNEIYEKPH